MVKLMKATTLLLAGIAGASARSFSTSTAAFVGGFNAGMSSQRRSVSMKAGEFDHFHVSQKP